MKRVAIQSLIEAIYPPQCVMCDARTATDFSLCGACWAQTPFIEGLVCDACGCPLPGEGGSEDSLGVYCDDCLTTARPWAQGRAALVYRDLGRKIVLSLKHADRTELARAAAPWLKRAVAPILRDSPVLVPIPLHRSRLFKRRFNQSALLAQHLATLLEADYLPDALIRVKRTAPLEGHSRDARFRALDGAIAPHLRKGGALAGKDVLVVDDVMTSGATLAAATEACHAVGAKEVCVLTLARVVKDA